jgi:anti-sigma factor RsiW
MSPRTPPPEEPFIARDATYHKAPPGLRVRVQSAVAREGRSRLAHAGQRTLAWGLAFAAVAAVSWNLGAMRGRAATEDIVTHDVLSAHLRAVMVTGRLIDVPSTDRHEVKPWFAGRVDFAPVVPDLSARGFILVGGRLDVLDGRTVAALAYRYRLHIVNVFERPAAEGDRAPQVLSRQGYNIVHWSRDGVERWAVSDLAAGELATIAE